MTTHPAAGTYFPAATLDTNELVNLTVQGLAVRADVDVDGSFTVFAGEEMIVGGTLDGTEGDLMVFFTAEALIWSAGIDLALTENAEAELAEFMDHVAEVAAESAELSMVHERGAALLQQAAEMEAEGAEPVLVPRSRNGQITGWREIGQDDPRHPAAAAAIVRRNGERLVRWNHQDESEYNRYVSDGQADTDGWFAPLTREAWAATRNS